MAALMRLTIGALFGDASPVEPLRGAVAGPQPQEDDPQAPLDFAEAVLAGRARVEDMDSSFGTYKTFWIEDYVTLVGQGAIADRAQERLGRTDQWMVLKRML